MMTFETDVEERSVSFALDSALYSREGIGIAAQVFGAKADVLLGEDDETFEVELRAKKKAAEREDLERLAGDFVNELLNQEYRVIVGGFNRKISHLIVTQALLAARGGENPPQPPAQEKTPEFQAEVAALMRETQDEIKKTMPKKLPPQGQPLPKAKEDAGA